MSLQVTPKIVPIQIKETSTDNTSQIIQKPTTSSFEVDIEKIEYTVGMYKLQVSDVFQILPLSKKEANELLKNKKFLVKGANLINAYDNKLKKEIKELNKQKEEQSDEIKKKQENLNFLKDEQYNCQSKSDALKKLITTHENTLRELKEIIDKKRSELEKEKKEKNKSESVKEKYENFLKTKGNDKKTRTRVEQYKKEIEKAEEKIKDIEQEIKKAREEHQEKERLNVNIENLRGGIEDEIIYMETVNNDIETLNKDIEKSEDKITGFEETLKLKKCEVPSKIWHNIIGGVAGGAAAGTVGAGGAAAIGAGVGAGIGSFFGQPLLGAGIGALTGVGIGAIAGLAGGAAGGVFVGNIILYKKITKKENYQQFFSKENTNKLEKYNLFIRDHLNELGEFTYYNKKTSQREIIQIPVRHINHKSIYEKESIENHLKNNPKVNNSPNGKGHMDIKKLEYDYDFYPKLWKKLRPLIKQELDTNILECIKEITELQEDSIEKVLQIIEEEIQHLKRKKKITEDQVKMVLESIKQDKEKIKKELEKVLNNLLKKNSKEKDEFTTEKTEPFESMNNCELKDINLSNEPISQQPIITNKKKEKIVIEITKI